MNCEKTARAIIEVEKDAEKYIVSIKRTKYKNGNIDKVYYTFPGGHIENGESSEDTVIREVYEELSVEIDITKEIANIFNSDIKRQEIFYICSLKSGVIKPGNGPEWTNPDVEKYGDYEIVYIKCNELEQYNILPSEIKNLLIKKYILDT